jgi:DNA-directed RNA polymerase specialized sigma24 family protein
MVALVREGIQALPEPFRSILVMREYGDLSYEQLAETLEVPKGTVESRLFRARMRLRDWLVDRRRRRRRGPVARRAMTRRTRRRSSSHEPP